MTKRKDNMKMTILIMIFATVFIMSFFAGQYSISSGTLVKIIFSRLINLVTFGNYSLEQTWTDAQQSVVVNIRLPRILAAVIIGAGLSVSGTAYQGMFRNPMVSPDLLGASTGAGFGASLAIVCSLSYTAITLSAFLFGLLAVAFSYIISKTSRMQKTVAMILAGVIVGSLFQSGTSLIKLISDSENQLPAITYWLMGSLASVKTDDVRFLIIPVLIGIVPLYLLRWKINLLTISEAESRSLGAETEKLRLITVICSTLITSACVSVSGMIGWVGLVIPHFCRMVFGQNYRKLIPSSMIAGATFLLLTDDLARVLTTSEIPLGILTSAVGAPVFIYLIVSGGIQREY